MSYLRYLCLLLMLMAKTNYVVFLLCFLSSCIPYAFSFSDLSIFDCPFDIR